MAAPYSPRVKNKDLIIYIALKDASTGRILMNPTIAAGDFQISKDGGAFANFGTLPVVTPAAGGGVKLVFSNTEINCDSVQLRGIDQTVPNEWLDYYESFNTTADPGIAQSGDAYARLGAPAGVSVSADVAAAKSDSAAIKAKTDQLAFPKANELAVVVKSINATTIIGDGSSGSKFRV